jgi:integrase
MGRKAGGIYPGENGTWQVDRWWKSTRLRQRGFVSFEEAEQWLIRRLDELRSIALHGERAVRQFDQVAAQYLLEFNAKASIVTETYLLQSIMPTIGHLTLNQVHDGTLAPYVRARLAAGKSHKTINLALSVVRRILKLAATKWRDENGNTWLEHAPMITMLPLIGHQREPRPITWTEQRKLMPALPDHLARMSLFTLNTGVRDDVVCSLRWDWEIRIPQLGVSVFDVPRQHVKGRRRARVVICNSVAQSIIEAQRGKHDEFVFVWRRERVNDIDRQPVMAYRPIQTMNNTAWQNARRVAGLGDLHVHDLRHTVGMRLREAGVPESTVADILWHSTKSMTQHYSVAQVVELHAALEKIRDDSGRWNTSLAMLKKEQEGLTGDTSPPKVPQQRKTA